MRRLEHKTKYFLITVYCFTQLNLNITTKKNFFFPPCFFFVRYILSTIETRKIAIFICLPAMSPLLFFSCFKCWFWYSIENWYTSNNHTSSCTSLQRLQYICYCPSPIVSNLVTWKQYTLLLFYFVLLLFSDRLTF